MKTSYLTGTLVELGSPPIHENGDEFDADGNPPPPRAIVALTEDAIRALGPNLTYHPVVILAAEEWEHSQRAHALDAAEIAAMQAKLAAVNALCDEWKRVLREKSGPTSDAIIAGRRMQRADDARELVRALGRKEDAP